MGVPPLGDDLDRFDRWHGKCLMPDHPSPSLQEMRRIAPTPAGVDAAPLCSILLQGKAIPDDAYSTSNGEVKEDDKKK